MWFIKFNQFLLINKRFFSLIELNYGKLKNFN
jgi:hypothetical protein